MVSEGQGRSKDYPSQQLRLLQTKLFVPRAHPDFVLRSRLLQQLDQSQVCNLTIVSAPAGFGKTSLICNWIAQRDVKIAWVSLDAGDNDLTRFWTYVVASLANVHTALTKSVLALLLSPQIPPIDTILADLINEIAAVPDSFTLVLDDYHFIDVSAIHKSLAFLLDNLPPQLHLIIASRSDPPLSLARLRARRQLVELRSPDLRFTEEEATVFLNQITGLGLSPDNVSLLEKRTEGWAAGLQLAALSMQSEADTTHFIQTFTGGHRYVFDYLAQEVLRRQPGPVRTFLLKSAVLDRFCGSLCDAVAEFDHGRTMLDRLEQSNLFVVPLDKERRWFRYHHLFSDFLRAQALQEFGEEEISALNRRACAWYEKHGFVEDAVRHALAAADYETAAGLIERHAEEMFTRSELKDLVRWAHGLPNDVVGNRPRLNMMLAWALVATGNGDEAERKAQDIERLVGGTVEMLAGGEVESLAPETRAALVEVSVLRSALAGATFDIGRSRRLAGLALPYLTDESQPYFYNRLSELRPIAVFNMAVAHELAGEVISAGDAFAEAFTLSYERRNLHIFPVALSHLAQMQIVQGQLHVAAETYQQALQLAKEVTGHMSPLTGTAYTGLGNLLYEWNDLATARTNLEEGLLLSRKWNNWDALIPGYIGMARVKFAEGDWAGALGSLNEISEICQKANMGMMLPALDATKAKFALARGDIETAEVWGKTLSLKADGEPSFLHEAESFILVRLWLAQGRLVEAQQLLLRLRGAAEAGRRWGRVLEISAIQALAYHAQGEIPQALATLEMALALAEPEGFIRIFVDEGKAMQELFHVAQERGIAPDYVSKLLAAFYGETMKDTKLSSQRSPELKVTPLISTSVQPHTEVLSDRELDVLRLISSGLTNEEIANTLFVSVNTVKTHLKNIYGKLGVRSRTQAVASARELQLL